MPHAVTNESISRARSLRRKRDRGGMVLWSELRDRRLYGLHVRKQVPLGPYIADLLCREHHLIVELDGDAAC